MPRSCDNRPVRSAKQVQLAPGYVDSSTLLFDSEDEGIDDAESEGEQDSEEEGRNESNEDRHVAKKPRLGGKFTAQDRKGVSPPPPDSSCLAYYPETYAAVQRWNKMLGLPPPDPMNDARTNKMPKREVDAPEAHAAKTLPPQGVINKNASYDETKVGFEKLPGEIRSRCFLFVLLLPYCVPVQSMPHVARWQLPRSSLLSETSLTFQG